MICRTVTPEGELVMESSVRVPAGKEFVGADSAGVAHVLEVQDVIVMDYGWYWCHRHICKIVDDRYACADGEV